MFRGHILKFKLKRVIKKIIQQKRANRRLAQKRKTGQEENNFALITKLLSDGEIPVKKVNVVNFPSLRGTLSYWLN